MLSILQSKKWNSFPFIPPQGVTKTGCYKAACFKVVFSIFFAFLEVGQKTNCVVLTFANCVSFIATLVILDIRNIDNTSY